MRFFFENHPYPSTRHIKYKVISLVNCPKLAEMAIFITPLLYEKIYHKFKLRTTKTFE